MGKSFYAYILRCSNGAYYVGHTDCIERRLAEHTAGQLGGYTARHGPVTLVWSQTFATRDDALAAERQIKRWGRAKKEALIAGEWDLLRQLSRRGRSWPKVGFETANSGGRTQEWWRSRAGAAALKQGERALPPGTANSGGRTSRRGSLTE